MVVLHVLRTTVATSSRNSYILDHYVLVARSTVLRSTYIRSFDHSLLVAAFIINISNTMNAFESIAHMYAVIVVVIAAAAASLPTRSATVTAFSPPLAKPIDSKRTALNAKDSRRDYLSKVAGVFAGGLVSEAFGAPVLPAGAEERLDFSLPSYDASIKGTGGFGDGAEAILNVKSGGALTDPGQGEGEKQLEAMRKAEEARKAKLEQKKAEMKAREEEDKRRALEKKEERAKRLKGIFD